MALWYYTRNHERQGPVTDRDLKRLAKSGQLGPEDLIWKEGLRDWRPAKLAAGLFPPATAATSAQSQTPPPLPPAVGARVEADAPPPLPQTTNQTSYVDRDGKIADELPPLAAGIPDARSEPNKHSKEPPSTNSASADSDFEQLSILDRAAPTVGEMTFPVGPPQSPLSHGTPPPLSGEPRAPIEITANGGPTKGQCFRFQPVGGELRWYSIKELQELSENGLLQRHYLLESEAASSSVVAESIPGLFPAMQTQSKATSRPQNPHQGGTNDASQTWTSILVLFAIGGFFLWGKCSDAQKAQRREERAKWNNGDAAAIAAVAFRSPDEAATRFVGQRIFVEGEPKILAATGIVELKVDAIRDIFVAFSLRDSEGIDWTGDIRFTGRVHSVRFAGQPPLVTKVVIVLDQVRSKP